VEWVATGEINKNKWKERGRGGRGKINVKYVRTNPRGIKKPHQPIYVKDRRNSGTKNCPIIAEVTTKRWGIYE